MILFIYFWKEQDLTPLAKGKETTTTPEPRANTEEHKGQ
jgi:hypothetical protein